MRKTFFLLSLLLSLPSIAHQTDGERFKRHEIGFSLGGYSRPGFSEQEADFVKQHNFEEGVKCGFPLPSLNIEYRYNLSRRLSLGLIAGTGFDNNPYCKPSEEEQNESKSYIDAHAYGSVKYVLPVLKYKWLIQNSEKSQLVLYSSVALGFAHVFSEMTIDEYDNLYRHRAELSKETKNSNHFYYQCSVFGIEYSGLHKGPIFYFELGPGNIVGLMGLRWRL